MEAGPERPSGTVTFLFSDIEGSTRLLQRLGALYGGALAEHQRLLREAFTAHGGHEIDTQGDSFFVAFRRAKDAVAAAVDGQRALADYDWPEGSELRVRMGIHTGEPAAGEERYVGLGVHRAARIGAAAVGGQVLVSESTRALLRDDPLPDISLRDLGLHRLKDIDEPERLFELNGPGLVSADLAGPAGRVSRRRLLIGGVVVAVAVAAALGTFLSRGGGAAKASTLAPNEVGVIDANSGSISAAAPVGSAPNGVAADSRAIWVANTDDSSVTRIDPATDTESQTITVGGSPSGVAVGAGAVWVANGADGTVSWISPASNTVVKTIPVGNGPTGVAYGLGKVWVANAADGTITEINPTNGKVGRTIPAAVGVTALTVAFRHLWAVAPTSGEVIEVTPNGSKSIGVGNDPDAITAAAGSIWVANRQDDTVSRIAPSGPTLTDTIRVGQAPDAIAAGPNAVWVANGKDTTLSKIDSTSDSVVKTLTLSNPPQGLASFGGNLYVSVRSSGAANRGGALRVETAEGGPDSLDPAYSYTPTGWAVVSLTNDGLVGFRRVGGTEGTQLVPDLAKFIPAPTDGGKTYTFTLRSGVRYSNGRLVQPGDIKGAIERALSAKPPAATTFYYSSEIVGASRCAPGKPCRVSGIVTNPIAKTITFHLTAPDPDFLTKLAMPVSFAVPPGTPARPERSVPATGPYDIASYSQKQRIIRLVRNPKFAEWSQDAQPAGYPDTIEITWPAPGAPPQTDAQLTRDVEKGTTDVALFSGSPPMPRQTLDQLKTRYPSRLRLTLEQATWYFFLNTRVPPFSNLKVRTAVETAFDRAAFGRLLTPEYSTTCDILPPGYPGYQRGCPFGGTETSRLAKAKALVRASGELGAHVGVWTPAPIAFEGRYMVSLLEELGFHASLHTVPPSQIEEYFMGDILNPAKGVQTGYVGWNADYPSSLAFFEQQLSCAAFSHNPQRNANPSEFCDRHIDTEAKNAAQEQVLNPPAATLLWERLEKNLLARAPLIPTYNGRAIVFVSKRVGNFQYHPQWGVLLDQLWVK